MPTESALSDGDRERRVSLLSIYFAFFRMGALAFGGGLSGWVYREAVEVKRWVDASEFASGLALSQILPGTNIGNMTVYLGLRMRGVLGAIVGLAGVLSLPFFASILLLNIYGRIAGNIPWLDPALDGITAGAIGLLVRMGFRTGTAGSRSIPAVLVLVATFVMVGVLQWPLLPVVAMVAPLSIGIQWWRIRTKPDAS